MENQRELTFGEKAVGLTFNHAEGQKHSLVHDVKVTFAKAIDLNKDYHARIEKPTWTQNVLHTAAFNACIAAQMAVVKFITWTE